jgi:hypothetical protein
MFGFLGFVFVCVEVIKTKKEQMNDCKHGQDTRYSCSIGREEKKRERR